MSFYTDALITDFTDAAFKRCFRQYFAELGIEVRDWDGLFEEMNADSGNEAYIRTDANGNVIGFIQFIPIRFTSWFLRRFAALYGSFGYRQNTAPRATARSCLLWPKNALRTMASILPFLLPKLPNDSIARMATSEPPAVKRKTMTLCL